jgi:hypothetical protein
LPSKEIADLVQFWAAVATFAALLLGAGAVWYAARQLSLAKKAGSGSSLIALSEAFRQCWQVYISAGDDEKKKNYAFGDLANTLEVACAIFWRQSFFWTL